MKKFKELKDTYRFWEKIKIVFDVALDAACQENVFHDRKVVEMSAFLMKMDQRAFMDGISDSFIHKRDLINYTRRMLDAAENGNWADVSIVWEDVIYYCENRLNDVERNRRALINAAKADLLVYTNKDINPPDSLVDLTEEIEKLIENKFKFTC